MENSKIEEVEKYRKMYKDGLKLQIRGLIIGAIIGANISAKIEVKSLKRYFGIFLVGIAIYEIYSMIKEYKKEKYSNNKN